MEHRGLIHIHNIVQISVGFGREQIFFLPPAGNHGLVEAEGRQCLAVGEAHFFGHFLDNTKGNWVSRQCWRECACCLGYWFVQEHGCDWSRSCCRYGLSYFYEKEKVNTLTCCALLVHNRLCHVRQATQGCTQEQVQHWAATNWWAKKKY